MQPNFNQEYKYPAGAHSPDTPESARDLLDSIYQKGPNATPTYYQLQAERAPVPESKDLYAMADKLAEARAYRLDAQLFAQKETESSFFRTIGKRLFSYDVSPRRLEPLEPRHLVREESAIGATLFGARRSNERIEFFNEDRENWFFYQSLTDSAGNLHSVTFHYEVNSIGILRVSDGNYSFIHGQEFDNFILATQMYYERVMRKIYNRDPATGKLLQ